MRLRIADGYAGFGEIAGCGRTLVILLDIEQHHAIDQIALRHTTDIVHRVRSGQQQHIITGIPRCPCGMQEVGVVFGLIDVATNRRT